MSLVHYIIVRKDLPVGTAAAMIAHAAGESFGLWVATDKKYAQKLVQAGPVTVVVLSADNEQLLEKINHEIQGAVKRILFHEPDAPWNGQLMAIGIVPAFKKDVSKYFEHLKLYKGTSMKRRKRRRQLNNAAVVRMD